MAYNLRGGLWADFMLPLKGGLTVGPEIGLSYIAGSSGGVTSNLFDLPVNAKLDYSLGKALIEGFGGFFSSVTAPTSSVADFAFGLDVGARVRFGHLYAEGSYVFGLGRRAGLPPPRSGIYDRPREVSIRANTHIQGKPAHRHKRFCTIR